MPCRSIQPSMPPAPETLSSWSGSPVRVTLAPMSSAILDTWAMCLVSTMPASSMITSWFGRME